MKKLFTNKKIYTFFGILFLFVIWTVFANIKSFNQIVPSIFQTAKALIKLLSKKEVYISFMFTLCRLFLSLVISLLFGVVLGSVASFSEKIYEIINPTIKVMRSLPIASIIIIMLLLLGDDACILTGIFMMFPIIFEGVTTSFKNIDKTLKDDIKTLSEINPYIIKNVYLPLSYPYVLSSVMQSLGIGIKVIVMSEFVLQPENSIGAILFSERINFEMDNVFALTFLLLVIIFIIDFLLKKVNKKISKIF